MISSKHLVGLRHQLSCSFLTDSLPLFLTNFSFFLHAFSIFVLVIYISPLKISPIDVFCRVQVFVKKEEEEEENKRLPTFRSWISCCFDSIRSAQSKIKFSRTKWPCRDQLVKEISILKWDFWWKRVTHMSTLKHWKISSIFLVKSDFQ